MTGDIIRGTIYALVIGLVLNLILFFVGNGIAGPIEGVIGGTLQEVPVIAVIVATLVSVGFAGAGVYILSRMSEDFLNTAMWITLIVALLTLIMPYSGTENSASFATLGLMHVVVGMAILFGLINYVWRRKACLD